jgi:EKC/KEOPS complex subunit CGI121/TPRKB
MASVRTFTLPHYEAFPVHVALFKDVTNAAFLRSQLLEANPDFDYAFLDASMVSIFTLSTPSLMFAQL